MVRPHDVTFSWCLIGEALNRSRHPKITHSAGLIIGNGTERVTVHHTLLAHNDFRNPLVIDGGTHDFVNNVVYDWGVLGGEIIDHDSRSFLNFVGNFYIPGPSTQPHVQDRYEILISPPEGMADTKVFVQGNLGPHRSSLQASEWAVVGFGYELNAAPETYRSVLPFAAPSVIHTGALEARDLVVAGAGATLPRRDAVDARISADVLHGTGRIIDSPAQVGGYPVIQGGTPPLDSDHDGMPDAWEQPRGLDPFDPRDGARDRDADGYTNIEEYLNGIR